MNIAHEIWKKKKKKKLWPDTICRSELPDLLKYIYYWYSLILLIGRTIVMFLSTSEIHDSSQKPLEIVRKIKSRMWSTEVLKQIDSHASDIISFNFFL